MLGDGVELAIVGFEIDTPETGSPDVRQARAEPVAQQAEQPEDDIAISARICHDLRRLQFGLLFQHNRQQHQTVP